MTKTMKNRLLLCWKRETGGPETQAWRNGLTEEELAYVNALDDRYIGGVAALCSAVLVRDQLRSRFAPEEIKELETVYDHCVLRTCGGRSYVARLGRDGNVILEEAS